MYRKLGKYRLPYSYLMALIAVVLAHKPPVYYGLVLIALGMALRFWAAGHIQKNDEVSKGGPYAFTRNPLYLGSFLGAVGAFILGNEFVMLAVFVVTYTFVYGSLILSEEDYLREHYGEDFIEYRRNVPIFLPRLTPYRAKSPSEFSWARAFTNKEHKYSTTSVLVPVLVLAVAFLRK